MEVRTETEERLFLGGDQRKLHRGGDTGAHLEERVGIWIQGDRGRKNSRKRGQHQQREQVRKIQGVSEEQLI